jgi:hypothetical protein
VSAPLASFLVLETGAAGRRSISPAEALDFWGERCAAATGFPPYHFLSEQLRRDDGDEIAAPEKAALAAALQTAQAWRVSSPPYTWPTQIKPLLAEKPVHTGDLMRRSALTKV